MITSMTDENLYWYYCLVMCVTINPQIHDRQCWEYNYIEIFNGRGIKHALQFNVHKRRYYFVPVPETKFNGPEGERLGQLVVTPEVVVSKINNMKENKSPGVDGIAPKILKETVEQISPPLAHVFNMSLQQGIVLL